MNDVIERVARAICGADGDHCVWPDCGCSHRARAAIAALREPTMSMIARGVQANGTKAAWQAMIDDAAAWASMDVKKALGE